MAASVSPEAVEQAIRAIKRLNGEEGDAGEPPGRTTTPDRLPDPGRRVARGIRRRENGRFGRVVSPRAEVHATAGHWLNRAWAATKRGRKAVFPFPVGLGQDVGHDVGLGAAVRNLATYRAGGVAFAGVRNVALVRIARETPLDGGPLPEGE
jgi:hypothetical protein